MVGPLKLKPRSAANSFMSEFFNGEIGKFK